MSDSETGRERRCLARLESELLKAEEAFSDADARFKAADQDRRSALATINRHQQEIDQAIAELRRRSIPGTKWRVDVAENGELLELHSEDIVTEDPKRFAPEPDLGPDTVKPPFSKDFDVLKAARHTKSDDPVLKVVAAPRG